MADYGLELSTAGNVYSKYSNKYIDTTKDADSLTDGYLDFDGYLKLLVAQMSNQDFNDPMSDSEMLNQLAQYSMLEGIKNMTQQTNISYASSLVGKVVTVSENGMYMTGRIDSVTIYNGEPWIVINGNAFKSSSVSDIVDDGAYAELREFLGRTVEVTGEDGMTIKGKVQNILFIGGEGYLAVNGNIYYASKAKIVEDDDTEGEGTEGVEGEGEGAEGAEGVEGEGGTEGAEGVEGEGGAEGAGSTEGAEGTENDPTLAGDTDNGADGDSGVNTVAANDERLVTQSVYLNSKPGNGVSYRAQALTDLLIKEIDKVNLAAGAKEKEDDKEETYYNNYVTQTAYVTTDDYSAGILSDSDIFNLTSSNYRAYGYSDSENIVSRTDGAIDKLSNTNGSYQMMENGNVKWVEDDDINTDILGEESGSSGTTSSAVASSAFNNAVSNYNTYLKAYSARRGTVKGVTSPKGVSTGDCVPHRISVEQYPEEAALADALGTRMYDIRFIYNTAITSRINTSQVIGHTSGGKAVTEIGYSGVGQLGEVVTFQDGTQRVEIMLKDGRSSWLTTSGNLTLDEICATTGAPGSLTGKLTGEEAAIRFFSRPMGDVSEAEKRSMMNYVISNSAQ